MDISSSSLSESMGFYLNRSLRILALPKVPILAPTFFLLFVNNLTQTSEFPLSFALFLTHLFSNQLPTSIMVVLFLLHHLVPISDRSFWGFIDHLYFNPSKASLLSISFKYLPFSPQLNFDWTSLHSVELLLLLGWSISSC